MIILKSHHLIILTFSTIWLIVLCRIFIDKIIIKNTKYNKTFCGIQNPSAMESSRDESFYVHLLSNVKSPESHRNNTVANFVSKLAEKISLKDAWEVGLSEISYTKSWFNIKTTQTLKIFSMHNSSFEDKDSFIKAGYYPDVKTLVKAINTGLKAFEVTTYKKLVYRSPILRFDEITNRIYVLPGRSPQNDKFYYPLLTDELEYILGFRNISNDYYINYFIDPVTNEYYDSENEIRLNKFINYDVAYNLSVNNDGSLLDEIENPSAVQFNVYEMHVLVYCSIVHPMLVGDTYAKLLRQVEIPKSIKFGSQ